MCGRSAPRTRSAWRGSAGPRSIATTGAAARQHAGPRPPECSDEPACLFPRVEVYYSESRRGSLTTADPKVAEIHVVPGSALIAEHRGDQCAIELTAECLQIGRGTCTAGGISATLHAAPDAERE